MSSYLLSRTIVPKNELSDGFRICVVTRAIKGMALGESLRKFFLTSPSKD